MSAMTAEMNLIKGMTKQVSWIDEQIQDVIADMKSDTDWLIRQATQSRESLDNDQLSTAGNYDGIIKRLKESEIKVEKLKEKRSMLASMLRQYNLIKETEQGAAKMDERDTVEETLRRR